MDNIKVLINEQELATRIEELATKIMSDYHDEQITLICILKGSIYFTTELSKRIKNDVELEFMRISSYNDSTESSGNLDIKLDLDKDITNKNVIIVEDIIDTGRTLSYLKDYLSSKNPKTLKICTLLDKKERRVCNIEADYVAFQVPNKFVIGYGMDMAEKYRNLPFIGYIEE